MKITPDLVGKRVLYCWILSTVWMSPRSGLLEGIVNEVSPEGRIKIDGSWHRSNSIEIVEVLK